jgi:hypothetical protein
MLHLQHYVAKVALAAIRVNGVRKQKMGFTI